MNINQTQLAVSSYTLNFKADLKSIDTLDSSKSDVQKFVQNSIKENGLTADNISNSYFFEFSIEVKTISLSSSVASGSNNNLDKVKSLMKDLDLASTGYLGKDISLLSNDEAAELVSNDGFFGVSKTSKRLTDFVLSGAGSDLNMLKAGREGIIRGFQEAEKLWGEKLPDIAYDTISLATEAIDKQIELLGGTVLDSKI